MNPIELIVSDWNGTLFGLPDGEMLNRSLAIASVTDRLREALRGRVWRLPRVFASPWARAALRKTSQRYRANEIGLPELYKLFCDRMLQGMRMAAVERALDGYVRAYAHLVDARMVRPVAVARGSGVATAVLSADNREGILRILRRAGFADAFDTVLANTIEFDRGRVTAMTGRYYHLKAREFEEEFLDRRGYSPAGVVYIGDSEQDAPVAALLPRGRFVVPLLATEAFKQRMAADHGAFVPSSEGDLSSYLSPA